MNISARIIFSFTILLLTCRPLPAQDSEILVSLTRKISQTTSETEKSRLYMYRARNYNNIGEYDKAEDDYESALEYDHKGWIHLERGRFFMNLKQYEQVIKEAEAAQKETRTLKNDAQVLITQARENLQKKRNHENPPEIVLTKRWNTRRASQPSGNVANQSQVRTAYTEKNKKAATAQKRYASS